MDRRALLRTTGGVALAGLAGCPGGSPDGEPGDGGSTDGGSPNGETADGESTHAETTDTETSDGEPPNGNDPDGEPPAAGGLVNGSFEDGLDGWTVDRDLPLDPNAPGKQPVEAEATTTGRLASDGERALALAIDGRQDDGTIWVQQETDLSGVDTLAVDGYSESESFNTIAKIAVYAGPAPDRKLVEADFDTSAASEDHEGWKPYEYGVDHDGPGLVAVGISVVWETQVIRLLDDVRLLSSADGGGEPA